MLDGKAVTQEVARHCEEWSRLCRDLTTKQAPNYGVYDGIREMLSISLSKPHVFRVGSSIPGIASA